MGKDNKKLGFTLVELIVSFSVLSILLAAVAVLLPSFLNQYNHVQSTSRTQTVGNTLMEMIEGQLSYATSQINLITTENDDFTVVEYNDQDGNTIDMSVLTDQFETNFGLEEDSSISNGLFILKYAQLADLEDENLVTRNAIDWGYTDDFYIGNTVTAFTVTKAASEYRENVLEVSFTLTNSKNGMENTFTRLIECTNFASTTNNDIVIDGKDPSEDDVEKLPGTDIVIQSNVWPVRTDYPDEYPQSVNVTIKPSGIFKWDDGYYVISKNYSLPYSQWLGGPGGGAQDAFITHKITGRIVEYSDPNEEKTDLSRGDICKFEGNYYVFIDGGSYVASPGKAPDRWYLLPK